MEPPPRQKAIRDRCFRESAPRVPFPAAAAGQSICTRFEAIVDRFPGRIALKSRSRALSYETLDQEVNAAAHRLIDLGVGQQEPVGLLFEHSVESIVAQLAVLKAGALRVELDASFPRARLEHVLHHCGIRFLVTGASYLAQAKVLSGRDGVVIDLDDLRGSTLVMRPKLPAGPESLATISYTSGSTGDPKGIARKHFNEMHSVMRVTNSVGLDATDRMVFTRCSSVIPLHALLNGASYYPVDLSRDPDLLGLADWLRDQSITIYRSPVSTFRAFTRTLQRARDFPALRLIILQGEPVYGADVNAYQRYFNDDCVLVSSLGVSELGDYAHHFIDKSGAAGPSTVPGGYALTETRVTLLEPADVAGRENGEGEIGVQGPFVGVSGWRRPDLDHKLLCGNGESLTYRTGDVGTVESDGCILHLGRKDFQIKVRGYRIYLGEVEAALYAVEGIAQAAAMGRTDEKGDVQLVAYVVADASADHTTQSLRSALEQTLPAYMIPTLFVRLDSMPQTLTGKVDRRALPAPGDRETPVETSEPSGNVQEGLAAIWRDALELDRIGVDEHFLDLGGDSLKAMTIVARVVRTFELGLPHGELLGPLLEAGTIAEMAMIVEALSEDLPADLVQQSAPAEGPG